MSTKFKWILEDSIEIGNKYDKIYYGESKSTNDSGFFDYMKNPKTFINYGIIVKYCPNNNEVYFRVDTPDRRKKVLRRKHEEFLKNRMLRHQNICVNRHFNIRLTSSEAKIIKKNNNIIDEKILQKILDRGVY